MIKKFKHFSELVVFEHTVFSGAFILISMVVSSKIINDSVWMGIDKFILCILALVFARNFAMSFNRLVDRDIDAQNQRTKNRPSVDGRISPLSLSIFCFINAILFVLIAYLINDLAFYLAIPFLIILGGYSFMKRFSFLAHIVLGISLSLAPIAGNIAITGSVDLWCVALSCGVIFWVAGFDLLYSLQDISFDKAHKLHSIPSVFGENTTLLISRCFHILAIVFWGIFVYLSNLEIFGILGLITACFMLLYEQILVAKDLKNIPKAFFVTNGYLGFVFFGFILIDGIIN